MMEQALNLTWLALTAGSLSVLAYRRHDGKAVAALLFALVLLFPIISATGDMSSDHGIDSQALAAVLAAITFSLGLMVVGRLVSREQAAVSFILVPYSDPRSPPRR